MTPSLVSAAALVNPQHPTATVSGLPAEVSNNGSDVFGAYASTYWLDAFGPALQGQQWEWPSPTDVPSPVSVPDLLGAAPADATAELAARRSEGNGGLGGLRQCPAGRHGGLLRTAGGVRR